MSMQNEFNKHSYDSSNVISTYPTRKERQTQYDNTVAFWMFMTMIVFMTSILYFGLCYYVINNVDFGMTIVIFTSLSIFVTVGKLLLKD